MKKKPSFHNFQGHRPHAKSLVDKKFGRGARSNFWSLKFIGIKVLRNITKYVCDL